VPVAIPVLFHVILPESVPLFVIPVVTLLPVPVTAAVLIQKGCPGALTINSTISP